MVEAGNCGSRGQKAAAKFVDEFVKDGSVLGLGSEELVNLVIDNVAIRLASGRLKNIVGIPTCEVAAASAAFHGLPLSTLEESPIVDLAFEEVDQLDTAENAAIKGLKSQPQQPQLVNARSMVEIAKFFVMLADESTCVNARSMVEIAKFFVMLADESTLVNRLQGCLPCAVVESDWQDTCEELDDIFLDDAEIWRRQAVGINLPRGGDTPYFSPNNKKHYLPPLTISYAGGFQLKAKPSFEAVTTCGFQLKAKPSFEVVTTHASRLIIKNTICHRSPNVNAQHLNCRRRPAEGRAPPQGGDNPYLSAEGHNLVDVIFDGSFKLFGEQQPYSEILKEIATVEGVVAHGLLLRKAQAAVIAHKSGEPEGTALGLIRLKRLAALKGPGGCRLQVRVAVAWQARVAVACKAVACKAQVAVAWQARVAVACKAVACKAQVAVAWQARVAVACKAVACKAQVAVAWQARVAVACKAAACKAQVAVACKAGEPDVILFQVLEL
eukprot:gene14079-20028_t